MEAFLAAQEEYRSEFERLTKEEEILAMRRRGRVFHFSRSLTLPHFGTPQVAARQASAPTAPVPLTSVRNAVPFALNAVLEDVRDG